jgi:SDR family mycofactocin-dependent oxidoreductase
VTSNAAVPRVALVTGAARGIGAETVRTLCRQGYQVIAVDSCAEAGPARPEGVDYPLASREELDRLAKEFPDQILTRVVDVRDQVALALAAADGVAAFGRIDAVVAAAAVLIGGRPLWETPASHFDTLWDVDVRGVWNTATACIPHMLKAPDPSGARFVAIASAAGDHGLFRLAGYNIAKHAVVGLVKGLAADLVGTGVTAAAVSPGATRTRMLDATAALYGLGHAEDFASSHLIRRLITPSEIAQTVAFCCSVEGAVLNGSVVMAAGGFVG